MGRPATVNELGEHVPGTSTAARTPERMGMPNVVDGLRSPIDRMSDAAIAPDDHRKRRLLTHAGMTRPPNAEAGEVVYVSPYSSLVVQLKSLRDIVDPGTGQRIPGENVVAKFRNGVYRTTIDAPVSEGLLKKDGTPLLIVEMLEKRSEGFNVNFFRYETVVNTHREDKVQSILDQIERDPAVRARVEELLTQPRVETSGSKFNLPGKAKVTLPQGDLPNVPASET